MKGMSMCTCLICNNEYNSYRGLSFHVSKTHNISTKDYYDMYVDSDAHICKLCGKSIETFNGLNVGYSKLCKKCSHGLTLEKCIIRHGDIDGVRVWEDYCKKQAYTNSYEYKSTHHNMTKSDYDGYNKSRSITLEKCIIRHGNIDGVRVWEDYCKKQAYTNTLEYFISKHGDDGNELYNECNRKKVNSMENFITRYGNDGVKLFETYMSNKKMKNYSKISQKLFDDICVGMGYSITDSVYYYNRNKEFGVLDVDNGNYYYIDFLDFKSKKVIEFNGIMFHPKPTMTETEKSSWVQLYSGTPCEDVIKKDNEKLSYLQNNGYDVHIVWEDDYKLTPNIILSECISFLKDKG